MGRVKQLMIAAGIALAFAGAAQAQAPQTEPLLDPNVADEKQLATVPHITPAIAKAIVARRPYATVVDLDKVLSEQKLTPKEIEDVHGKLFVRLNLNTASDQEILAIPGIGKRMLHEFKEYRPYKAIGQFRREIGKYIAQDKREAELARLERYVFIK